MHDRVLAAYIRLSLEDGDMELTGKKESNSIANQRMLIQEYIRSHPEFRDYKIEFFCDDGYTGTNFERPEFQRMMSQMKLKRIQCIIVKDLSRFGREYLDVGSYLELLFPLFNVRFISINDDFDSNNYAGTTGGMELAFRNLINSLYSKDISIKVRSACKTRFRKGEYIGSSPFYGYLRDPEDIHRLIVDESVRRVIIRIFEMCIHGLSCKTIARVLNEELIPCPLEHKRLRGRERNRSTAEEKAVWIPSTVRKILKDERYTGKMVSNKRETISVGKKEMLNIPQDEWIIVENTHEEIISEEIYQLANEALADRVRTINHNTSWKNSGNLFVCGCCGRKLQKNGSKDTRLYCMQTIYQPMSECRNIDGNLRNLENTVLETVKGMGRVFSNSILIIKKKEIISKKEYERRIAEFEKALEKLRAEKVKLYEKYRGGEISKGDYIHRQMKKVESMQDIEDKIAIERKKASHMIDLQKRADCIEQEIRSVELLRAYDPSVLRRVVERVIVYQDNRVEVVMKNRDVFEDINRIAREEGA